MKRMYGPFFLNKSCIYLLMCLAQYVKENFDQSQIITFHHHINYNVACNAYPTFAIQTLKIEKNIYKNK